MRSELILTLATITSLLAQSSSSYRVTHTYTLGGDGRWDYIVPDPPNHRLFIARQNRGLLTVRWNDALRGLFIFAAEFDVHAEDAHPVFFSDCETFI